MFCQRCRPAAGRSLLQGFTFAASHSLRFLFFSAGHSASQYLTATSLHLHSPRRCLRSEAPFFISMIITGRGWKRSGPSNVTSNSCGRVLNAARLGVFHRVKDDPRLLNISVDWTETASVAELMFITRFYFSLLC